MSTYYTIKNNTGTEFDCLPILEPIRCDAQKLFLKYLIRENKVTYTLFHGGITQKGWETLTVRNTAIKVDPYSSELPMPIILDENQVDVVTGIRIDCFSQYSEFIAINDKIDDINVDYMLKQLEADPKGIETYAAAINNLVELLEQNRKYSEELKQDKIEQLKKVDKKHYSVKAQESIIAFQGRARKRLQENKKN